MISCNDNRVSLYHGPYFKKGQEVIISINDKIIYNKVFKNDYSRDSNKKIKDYYNKLDSIKLYFKVNKNDTLVYLPKTTKRILVGSSFYDKIFVYTEKDSIAWIEE